MENFAVVKSYIRQWTIFSLNTLLGSAASNWLAMLASDGCSLPGL